MNPTPKISGSLLVLILGFSFSTGFFFSSEKKYKDLIPNKCKYEFFQVSKSSKDLIDSNKFNKEQLLYLSKIALEEYEKCLRDNV